MTLLDVCEPLFQYTCRLNRSARKGLSVEPAQVRGDIRAILADMRSKATSEPGLIRDYEQIELVLLFFVDFMIKESALNIDWEDLAHERNELAGDEKFFDLLDETLEDPSESAVQRLSIFYTCMGLGFTGWYTGQPEFLRKKMKEVAARIRGMMDTEEMARICPEAYEHVNTDDLVQPPGRRLLGVALVLAGLLITVFVANILLYLDSTKTMKTDLNNIINQVDGQDYRRTVAPFRDGTGG